MKAETFDRYGNPHVIECTRILVRDSVHNNPTALIIEHAPGQLWVCTSAEGDSFQRALQMMGVNATIVTDSIDPAQLEKLPGELILPDGA